jgi:hypothetical protein
MGRRWRTFLALLALALMPGLAAAPPAAAAPSGGTQAPAFRVIAQSAQPTFPERITFDLTAASDGAPIIAARLFYRPVAAEVTSLAVAEVSAAPQVTIHQVVDMRANYLPPGLDLQYVWSLTDAAGNEFTTAPQTFLYQDERFPWRTVSGGQVTVYYYAGDEAFGRDILATAQRTIVSLGARFGVAGTRPVHIVVYGNNRDFAGSLPANSAEWIGGQAHPELGLIVTGIVPEGGNAAEIRRIVPHEVSHLLLYEATINPYGSVPPWLDEGLAVYNQETADSSLDALLMRAVAAGALLPARSLNSSFPLDPTAARLSYAESVSLVRFILARYGDAKLGELLHGFGAELSPDEALLRVFGFDTDGLDREWKASLGYAGDRPDATLVNDRDLGIVDRVLGWLGITIPGAVLMPLLALVLIVTGGLSLRRRRPLAS